MLSNTGFDLWADGYDRAVGLSDEDGSYPFAGYRDVLGQIYNEILSHGGRDVLDIGFGTGTLTCRLYAQGCNIWGQDFSAKMLALAQAKMPRATLVQGDFAKGLAPSLRAQTYDAIVATYSLHHLTDPQKAAFLRDLLPLVRSGGRILIGDVAFPTRDALETCRLESVEDWDDEEFYIVADELAPLLPCPMTFESLSHCAGIVRIQKD